MTIILSRVISTDFSRFGELTEIRADGDGSRSGRERVDPLPTSPWEVIGEPGFTECYNPSPRIVATKKNVKKKRKKAMTGK
jgi:hypothetical protein